MANWQARLDAIFETSLQGSLDKINQMTPSGDGIKNQSPGQSSKVLTAINDRLKSGKIDQAFITGVKSQPDPKIQKQFTDLTKQFGDASEKMNDLTNEFGFGGDEEQGSMPNMDMPAKPAATKTLPKLSAGIPK